ncbi:MAG: flagellar biosynthesis protein FlhA [Nitrospirota bacterium]|nr:flagellar biosynthesis protein FlhA [Nitrospirota bacterium]
MADTGTAALPSLKRANFDIYLAFAVVGILLVMLVPLPPLLLDIFLSISITLSLIIILVSMYVVRPLEFSVFPSLLLIVTLYRLALNVASTRLILLKGNEGPSAAGHVIQSFGQFVVGGELVVGAIMFLILVVINFVVITKGAGRISEVAARFTLDAMPGKQMAIDADLNAGLISDTEARNRRKEIAREADFYGAMDGASKFVRGDAIAAVIITFINILGGLAIGVLQKGMDIGAAAHTYTLLTVGEGLVAQIPALIVSTAAGMIVTRAASDSNLGSEIARQVLVDPRVLASTAGILTFFGLIPGLPHLAFFSLAAVTGGAAYMITQAKKTVPAEAEEVEAAPAKPEEPEVVHSLLAVDALEIEVGYGLISLVDTSQGGDLLERIKSIRRQCALELGIVIPPIRIRDNLQLKPNQYSILIKGVEVAGGEVMPNYYLAMNPGTAEGRLEGVETKEPAFGLPAVWIDERSRERASVLGYTVVDPSTVAATHLTEVIKSSAADLLGRQDVQGLLDNLARNYPKVVEELVPNYLTLGGVQKVLQNLLRERVSIRDLLSILEALADAASFTKDLDALTEYTRQSIGRSICKQYQGPDGKIYLFTFDPELEGTIGEAIHSSDQGSYLALEPKLAQRMIRALSAASENAVSAGHQPVLLCSPRTRPHVRRLVERFIPALAVLSHSEIPQNIDINITEVVGLAD